MFWHPETQKYYTASQAQSVLKIAGVNTDNCESVGLFIPAKTRRPVITDVQTARQNDLPELIDGVWTETWTVKNKPPRDFEAEVTAELDQLSGTSNDRDKALAFLMADLWRAANPGMTVQEARAAVRSRLEVHLRNIKGF